MPNVIRGVVAARDICLCLLEADDSLKEILGKAFHLDKAVKAYLERKARTEHPDGIFDKQGRWYPSDTERRPCCQRIRSPSAAFPYSLMLHCRTVEHVANLFDVEPKILRRAIRHHH